MFRRLADLASGAVGGNSSTSSQYQQQVQQLQAMGFDATQARNALQTTHGNVEQAAELLLSGNFSTTNTVVTSTTHPQPPQQVVDLTNDGDTDSSRMQNAMQESMYSEEDRLFRQAQEASVAEYHSQNRSAAGNRAAEAAARRAAAASAPRNQPFLQSKPKKKKAPKPKLTSTTTTKPTIPKTEATVKNPMKVTKTPQVGVSHHHPNVRVPAKFSDKTREERVLRCADRLKPYPLAVDTLYRALSTIQQHPHEEKYRKIDKTTPGYKRSLENVPGAEDLLLAMNFHSRGAYSLVLERQWVDAALLYLGISALDGVKQSKEYLEAKSKLEFAKQVKEIQQSGNTSEEEVLRRAEYMQKCPSEPAGGSGALMQVVIADETIRRKFDGDDVLRDVLNWIGGHGSSIPDKIMNREWCLVDINRYPIAPIDCELNIDKTLQYIGCWPSGRLELRPSPNEWKTKGNNGQVLMGSSRGLAAAPRDAMH